MKALSCTFAALAILLSDVMCATVAFTYCAALAVVFWRKSVKV